MAYEALEECLRNHPHSEFTNCWSAITGFQALLRKRGIPENFITSIRTTSGEAFLSFLQAIESNTPDSLEQIFQESKFVEGSKDCQTSEFLDDYEAFEKAFHPLPVDIVLYFMHDVLLVREKYSPCPPQSSLEKILKIRSVIGWLPKIFPENLGDVDWKETFIDHDSKLSEDVLDWLGRTDQANFIRREGLEEAPIAQSDLAFADCLWFWLETHPQKPIQLVFSMVLCGMDRDIYDEWGQLDEELDKLADFCVNAMDSEPITKKEMMTNNSKRRKIGA